MGKQKSNEWEIIQFHVILITMGIMFKMPMIMAQILNIILERHIIPTGTYQVH